MRAFELEARTATPAAGSIRMPNCSDDARNHEAARPVPSMAMAGSCGSCSKAGDMRPTVSAPVYARPVIGWARLRAELAKFGTVGAVAYVVDVGVFNLLRADAFSPIAHKPITAKIVSSVLATLVAYAGNRYWTFRHRQVGGHSQSLARFFLLNAVAMGIAALCLAGTHYGLGLTSAAADNLSANVLGTGLGTLFRFWSYRRFVFTAVSVQAAPVP